MSNTAPRPIFLRALRAQKWQVSGALAELVDNSFGPARGDATRCEIIHDPSKRRIWVLDNGKSMDGGIVRVFQLGNAIGMAPGDIGLYGSGGTMALLWLADVVKVWTLRKDGYVNYDSVDWIEQIEVLEDFPNVSETWERANQNNTPADLLAARHGTMIELHLSSGRTFYPSNVVRDLSELYAPARRLGRKLTWTTLGKNGGTQRLHDPFEELDPEHTVVIDGGLMVNNIDYLEVRGEIGLVPGLSREKSKVAIGYGPRVIFRTRDCFKSPDPSESFQAAGIAGYIDLRDGWQPYLTVTKDEIAHSEVRAALMSWLFHKIRPILKTAEETDLQLLLDGIAINLQTRLERGERRTGEKDAGGPIPGEGHAEINIDPDTGDVTSGPDKPRKNSIAQIQIIPLDDAAMDGRLCLTDTQDGRISVFVNSDHPIIKEALKAQPVNRMALELLVTREIADLLEKDEELRQKTFRPTERELIDSKGSTGATIHRLLMDRVRHPAEVA